MVNGFSCLARVAGVSAIPMGRLFHAYTTRGAAAVAKPPKCSLIGLCDVLTKASEGWLALVYARTTANRECAAGHGIGDAVLIEFDVR